MCHRFLPVIKTITSILVVHGVWARAVTPFPAPPPLRAPPSQIPSLNHIRTYRKSYQVNQRFLRHHPKSYCPQNSNKSWIWSGKGRTCFSLALLVNFIWSFLTSLNLNACAGTGKSVLLRKIIESFGPSSPSLAITASTGIAGLNIGGSTIHSFAGIGLGKESADALATKIYFSKFAKERWLKASTLIIDES